MAKKETRKRNFACVVYPESAPERWFELLSTALVPAFVSPLHDRDIDPDPEKGGQPKKPHYHVMVMFDGLKSEDQVKEIFDKIGGVGLEVVNSIRSYARYLCHLDNPDKAQYDPELVISYSGADYMTIIGLASDKYKAVEEMMQFCRDNHEHSYARLMEYASVHRRDWFRALCDNSTIVMREYLKSLQWDAHVVDLSDEELAAAEVVHKYREEQHNKWRVNHGFPPLSGQIPPPIIQNISEMITSPLKWVAAALISVLGDLLCVTSGDRRVERMVKYDY